MSNYRKNSHSISNLSCHLVWATKYRYSVLQEGIQHRCRDLLIQVCDTENVHILKGIVSKNHIHMRVEYPATLSISILVKKLKGRLSGLLDIGNIKMKKDFPKYDLYEIGSFSYNTIISERLKDALEKNIITGYNIGLFNKISFE